MKNILSILAVFALLISTQVEAQITQKPEFGKFAITGATVHTVTNGVIENGVVLIEGEKITYVGDNASIDASYTTIDATGKHVYPGLMDSYSTLGLIEVSSVSLTNDSRENGAVNPHMNAFTAINPNNVSIPVTRVNGVTHVVSTAIGNTVAGTSTLIDLWGYSPDSMAVKPIAGLNINWPTAMRGGSWDTRSDKKVKEEYEEAIKEVQDYWSMAVFYNKMMTDFEADNNGKIHPDKDPQMEAMRAVVTGEVPIIVNVSREKDILNALEWIKNTPEAKFVLSGVAEGWRVADEIAEAGVPVITNTLYTPRRSYDNYQRPYQNPGLLSKAGVKVLISAFESENVRNLPYHAGYAAAYGMGTDEALKAVTIYPAEVFGVDDLLGSLEDGKQANLIITDGDPFDPLTNIEHVFIKGYKIPMVSRHTQLYEEFLERDAVNK